MKKPKIHLSKEEVLHIAKLAKLRIKESEIETFRKQLSEILEYVGKLNELDTKKTADLNQVTCTQNTYRDDKLDTNQKLTAKEALANTKSQKDKFFKVKAIFTD